MRIAVSGTHRTGFDVEVLVVSGNRRHRLDQVLGWMRDRRGPEPKAMRA